MTYPISEQVCAGGKFCQLCRSKGDKHAAVWRASVNPDNPNFDCDLHPWQSTPPVDPNIQAALDADPMRRCRGCGQ